MSPPLRYGAHVRWRSLAALGLIVLVLVLGRNTCGGRASVPAPPPVGAPGDYHIYRDTLTAGWRDWSWGSAVSFDARVGRRSQYAIRWRPAEAWGGLYLHLDAGLSTAPFQGIAFSIRAGGEPQRLNIGLYDAANVRIGDAQPLTRFGGWPRPGQWQTYIIPLVTLGAASTTIKGVALSDATGSPQPALLVDDLRLVVTAPPPPSPTLIPTYSPTPTPTPTPSVTPTPTPTPSPTASPTPPPPPVTSAVYMDALGSGWANWSWSSTVTLASTEVTPYSGTAHVKAVSSAQWSGLYLRNTAGGLATSSYSQLRFSARLGGSTAGAPYTVYLKTASGDLTRVGLASTGPGEPVAGSWKTYAIDLTTLGAANVTVIGVVFQSGGATLGGVLYVDAVDFYSATAPGVYFATLPPGADLSARTDAWCAANVKPRPEIKRFGYNRVPAQNLSTPPAGIGSTLSVGSEDSRGVALVPRITGNYTGTTDEIIQWAACKWGIDEDVMRAVAVRESWWRQDADGDYGNNPTLCANIGMSAPCYESYSLFQIKAAILPDTWPYVRNHTAFAADYYGRRMRSCYNGWTNWLAGPSKQPGYPIGVGGDLWGCVGYHYSGDWWDSGATAYVEGIADRTGVKGYLAQRRWEYPSFVEYP